MSGSAIDEKDESIVKHIDYLVENVINLQCYNMYNSYDYNF